MRERPIIFSGPMVRALLDGRKTQTRRVMNPRPVDVVTFLARDNSPTGEYGLCFHPRVVSKHIQCPYGVHGDRLWVRETWASGYRDGCWGTVFAADHGWNQGTRRHLKGPHFHAKELGDHVRWKPSIHMPRWASRILLEITDVRVQRVQGISEEDAKAEGARTPDIIYPDSYPRAYFYVENFRLIWDSINAKRGCGWNTNPWVWAITFKVIEARRSA